MKKIFFCITICFLGSILSGLTQTGNLIVTVKTSDGQLLPGASLTIESGILMGTRTAVAGVNGKVFFRNLPPGVYRLTASLEGFKSKTLEGIQVRIEKDTIIEVVLELGEATEEITVDASQILLDTTTSTVSTEFDFANYINHMPVVRHYIQIAALAGGVLGSTGDPSVLGAGAQDNLYLIDGVFAVDSRTQTWGGQFNMDIVQDMSLQTVGISAEYGHATGSVFNIVTKIGSNLLHGVARLELYRTKWNDITVNNPERNDDDVRLGNREDQWNLSGGGPIIKDSIWWYTSYTSREKLTDWQRRLNPFDEGELTDTVTGELGHFFSIKGTFQLTDTIKASAMYKEDPIEIGNGASYKYFGSRTQPETDAKQTQGGSFAIVSASWIMNEDMILEARWTDYQEELNLTAQEESANGYWGASKTEGASYVSADNWFWGVYPYQSLSDRNHDGAGLSLSWLLETDHLGTHDIKIGAEYLDEWGIIRNLYFPGGYGIFTGKVEGVGFDNTPWLQRIDIINRLPEAEEHIFYWTFYLQDSFSISDDITLNLGVRSDIATAENNHEETVFGNGLFRSLAPRLGLALAIGDGSIHASFGRYYDLFSMYIVDYFNTFPFPEVWSLYEPTDGIDGRSGWKLTFQWTEGNAFSPHTIEDDLSAQFMDEFSLGMDYMIRNDIVVGLYGVRRLYRDLIIPQDIDGNKKLNIENLRTDEYGSKWKEHLGAVLSIRKRPVDDNLFLAASLTYSSTEGLCSETLATGLNTYANNPLQRYDNAGEWWGPIPTLSFFPDAMAEPSLIAKFQAVYLFPNDWYIGLIGTWHNGFLPTTNDEDVIEGFGTVTFYPNGRGDMKRLPSQLRLDVQFGIEQAIQIPFESSITDGEVILGIYANVINFFNEQKPNGVQQFIGASNYGEYTSWNEARSYILGFRLEL